MPDSHQKVILQGLRPRVPTPRGYPVTSCRGGDRVSPVSEFVPGRCYGFSFVSGRERSVAVSGRIVSLDGGRRSSDGCWSLAGAPVVGGLPSTLAPVAKAPLLITPVVPVVPADS